MVRILLVDDEEKIVDVFAAFLTKKGFEVIKANGGEAAVGLLNAGVKMDLMILDMKMPKVNGFEVLRVLKALNYTTPVMVVTGSLGHENNYQDLASLGISQKDIIYKPVDLFSLLEEIMKRLQIKI